MTEQLTTGVSERHIESNSLANEDRTEIRIAEDQQHKQLYEKRLDTAYRWSEVRPAFVRGILQEVGLNYRFGSGRTLDYVGMDADEPGAVLVYPDETRIFVGRDETAHTRGDYGFAIQPNDPVPMPETVEGALDLLKPLGVRSQMEETESLPQRQGEWWLLETDEEPQSSAFKGGVSKRPFGWSPMENHVPTEFAFGVSDDALYDRIEAEYPNLVRDGDSLRDIFNRIEQAIDVGDAEDVELNFEYPEYRDLEDVADGVFVRGTLRHRENDHYMETIGDEWRLARTHDIEVFTADSTTASRVRRD